MAPFSSAAMQKLLLTQSTVVRAVESICVGLDQEVPFHLMASPKTTAMQAVALEHDTNVEMLFTPNTGLSSMTWAGCQLPVHAMTWPFCWPARQNVAVGQLTESK
jgi:hypothetical protein